MHNRPERVFLDQNQQSFHLKTPDIFNMRVIQFILSQEKERVESADWLPLMKTPTLQSTH